MCILQAGAHVYFSNNPDRLNYGAFDCGANGKLSITRWEGNDCLNFSSLVYAYGQKYRSDRRRWMKYSRWSSGCRWNEEAECWWSWKGRQKPSSAGDIAPGTTGNWIPLKGRTEESVVNNQLR